MNNKKIRRQEINYKYNNLNVVIEINKLIMEYEPLNMKLLKLSWNFKNKTIKIIFKSSFETRRFIADKLRDLDWKEVQKRWMQTNIENSY